MKFIIEWDIGNGPEFDEVYADDMFEAHLMAQERLVFEATQDYGCNAHTWSEELAEEYGL